MNFFLKALAGALVDKALIPLGHWLFEKAKQSTEWFKLKRKQDKGDKAMEKYIESGDPKDLADFNDSLNND